MRAGPFLGETVFRSPVGETKRNTKSSYSSPAWLPFGGRHALRQNCGIPPAAGVDSAGEVFASLFIDLQGFGDVIALRPMAKDQAIRRIIKAKVCHEVPPVVAANSPTTASHSLP